MDVRRSGWSSRHRAWRSLELTDTRLVNGPNGRFAIVAGCDVLFFNSTRIDIVRELIDGAAGRFAGDASIASDDELDWPAYVAKVEAAALHHAAS